MCAHVPRVCTRTHGFSCSLVGSVVRVGFFFCATIMVAAVVVGVFVIMAVVVLVLVRVFVRVVVYVRVVVFLCSWLFSRLLLVVGSLIFSHGMVDPRSCAGRLASRISVSPYKII